MNYFPEDRHKWRRWDEEIDGENYAPDPHSSQIVCEVCKLDICMFCGTDDPGYTTICAKVGVTFPSGSRT